MKYISLIYYLLGFVFIFSSLLKVASFASFVQEIGVYMDAYFWSVSKVEATFLAVGVCAAELIFGVLTFMKRYMFWACGGLLVLLSFFVGLTARNLFFPTLMGSVESCGCFGELIHFSPTSSFIKSVVLWMMTALLLVLKIKKF